MRTSLRMHNELINPNSAIQDYECNIEDNRTINAKGTITATKTQIIKN